MQSATPPNLKIQLRENAQRGAIVQANLLRDFPSSRLAEVETAWTAWRSKVPSAEHALWDWRDKLDPEILQLHRFVAIEYSQIQALMAIVNVPCSTKLESGANLVYISYLETAPWNLSLYTSEPLYSGCGTQLIAEAIRRSIEMGCNGRIGLHALQQSEFFYETRCGMTRLGPDAEYDGLVYYEFTPDQAEAFLKQAGLTG